MSEDFLHHFTTWLASVGHVYHITAKSLSRWRRINDPARHKTWGIPLDGNCFTDGAIVVAYWEERGVVASCISNWLIEKPRSVGRTKGKGTKKPRPVRSPKPTKKSASASLIDSILADL